MQCTKGETGLFLQLIYVAPVGESVTPTGYAVGPTLVRLISLFTSGRGRACLVRLHRTFGVSIMLPAVLAEQLTRRRMQFQAQVLTAAYHGRSRPPGDIRSSRGTH